MARRNPQSPLAPGVFEEAFDSGVLDTADWDALTAGTASAANVSLATGMMRLKVDHSTGPVASDAVVISDSTYGHGTYDFNFRTASNAALPTASGTPVEGSTTEIWLYIDPTHYIKALFSASANSNQRNTVLFQIQNGAGVASKTIAADTHYSSFQTMKIVWATGRVDIYLAGKIVYSVTASPSSAAKIRFSVTGTNSNAFGGLATLNTPRYAYFSFVRYTPDASVKFVGGTVAANVTMTGYVNEANAAITAAGTVSATVTMTGAATTSAAQIGVAGTVNAIVTMTGAATVGGSPVAASTGWLNPTATVSNGWVNPTAIFASDDARSTVTIADGAYSPELWAYSFAALNIPEGSTINGVRVSIEGTQTGTIANSYFRLVNTDTFTPKSANAKTLTLPSGSGATSTDTGFKNAGTAFLTSWTSPTSSLVQDGTNASVAVTATETPYAIWDNFDFSAVPAGATITGIEVRINGRSTVAGDYSYFSIGNVAAGTPYATTQKTATLPVHATTNGWVTMGGPGDLWGGYPSSVAITQADLSSSFGLAGAWGTTAANTYYVDGVQFKIYYTTVGGTETAVTLGSTTDLWGEVDTSGDNVKERSWLPADFNSKFAFWGQFQAGTGGATISIDQVRLNVDYTTPGVVSGGGGSTSGDTGWLQPSTMTNNVGWTNPNNAKVQDGVNATATMTGGAETPYLRASAFAGLSTIPSGATINGIEVRMNGRTTAAQDYSYVQIFDDVVGGTGVSPTAIAMSLPVSGSTAGWVTAGGPTNLWGGTWTPADLTTLFGIGGAWASTPANQVFLDGIEVKVYYTVGTGSGGGSGGTVPGIAIPLPSKILATYFEAYRSLSDITQVPLSYNQIYLFHCVPVGGNWSGTGAFTLGSYANVFTPTRISTVRARGQRVVLTCGGANAAFAWLTRAQSNAFLASFATMYSQLGVIDGIDFNNFETFSSQYPGTANANALATEMIYISQQLKATYGSNFSVSAPPAPGAGFAPADRVLIAAMNAAGAIDYVAPQFYDSSDFTSTSTNWSIAQEWIAMVGANKFVFGTGSNYGSGTVAMTTSQMVSFWNTYLKPAGARGAMGFSASTDYSAGTPWSFGTAMRAVLV